MALFKDFVVKHGLEIEGTLQSGSTGTGALIVRGGGGLAGNINIGGSIKRVGNITGGDFTKGSQFSLGDVILTDTISQGTVNWSIVNYFGKSQIITTNTNVTLTNAASIFIDGAPSTASTNVSIINQWALYATSGTFYIGETSGNTGSFAGNALQVEGGISAKKGLYVEGGGNLYGAFSLNNSEILTRATQNTGLAEFPDGIRISTSTQSVSTDTGALVVDRGGGVGVGGNLFVGGVIVGLTTATLLGTQNAISTSTGALTLAGGLGIGQDLYARNGTFVSGAATTGSVAGNSLRVTNNGGLGVSGSSLFEGQVWVTNETDSVSTGSGAVVIRGGLGVGKQLSAQLADIYGDAPATTLNDAALTVAGGVSIGKNLIIGATDSSTGTTASNALSVAGGVFVSKDLTVSGNTVIRGDLVLLGNGTQVTVNSTNTYIVDPVIEVGGGADKSMLTVPDVYDKGLLIHYQNSVNTVTDYRAFLGLENTTERFIFKQDIIPGVDGSNPNGDYYNSGTWSTLEAGSLILRDATASTDENSGALIIEGGVGVGGNSVFASTTTFTLNAWNVNQIADNTVQIPNGGLGAKYLYVAESGWINGSQILTTGTVNNNIGGIFTLTFSFVNLTQSVSTDTGAVTISGGLGVGGNANIGGWLTSTGTVTAADYTQSTDTSTGGLIVLGGAGIGKNLNVGGLTKITDGTTSTTVGDGALTVTGGVGIGANLRVGTDINVAQRVTSDSLRVTSSEDSSTTDTGAAVISGGLGVANTINATRINIRTASITSGSNSISTNTGDLTVVGGVGIGLDAFVGGNVRILSTLSSETTATGALTVAGGVGVGRSLYVGESLVRQGNMTRNGWGSSGVGLILSTATYTDISTGGINAGTLAIHSMSRPTVATALTPTWNDAATLFIENAPQFQGGGDSTNKWSLFVGSGNVKVNANSINNGTTTSGALQVAGGVGVGGNLTVGQRLKANTVQVQDNVLSSPALTGIASSSPITIDSFIGNEFTTAKYLVQIVDIGTPNKFHVVELVVAYDGSAQTNGAYISQYGIITNQGELGSFDAVYADGDINVVFTPSYTPISMTIRAIRMAIIT